MNPNLNRRWTPARLVVAVLVALVALLAKRLNQPAPSAGSEAIAAAIAGQQSGVRVTTEGRVEKVLPDDREGDRHQRFIVRVAGGHSLLVAHNIDIAGRVPVREGDTVTICGQYEWSERGGTLHWTHHDPGGRHADGWIGLNGQRYE